MAVSDHHCGGGGRSWRFAVACCVLSRCVKAEAAAAANGRHRHHPTMLLMPGADVEPDVREEAAAAAQLKIMYGGRMLVFDDFFPAGGAVVELVRAAARAGQDVRRAGAARRRVGDSRGLDAGLPVVRKVSLQRFVEKRRRMRFGATAPNLLAIRRQCCRQGRRDQAALTTPRSTEFELPSFSFV